MHGYFVLYGQGGELDKVNYAAEDENELKDRFLEWINNIVINEGDTIKIIAD